MEKTLLIIFTHGDEKIGLEAVKKLKGFSFDLLIANPKVAKKKKRFIDVDLNRSYPGKKNSPFYEQRKAYQNFQIAKEYKYVIDIHEANKGTDDFIIIPRKELGTFPLERINLKRVLFWPEPKGPLGGVLRNTIELEFGSKKRNRKEMIEKAVNILKAFFLKENFPQKEFYYVYGKLIKQDFKGNIDLLSDFKETEANGERFLPLLTRQYLKEGIVCYKMKIC